MSWLVELAIRKLIDRVTALFTEGTLGQIAALSLLRAVSGVGRCVCHPGLPGAVTKAQGLMFWEVCVPSRCSTWGCSGPRV